MSPRRPRGRRGAVRTRPAPALLAALLLAPLLTGCGEDDPFEAYCSVVADEKPGLLAVLDDSGDAGLLPALPILERLEAAAPVDIADDWSVVTQRLRGLAEALEAAGVDPASYASYDPDDPPEGVSDDQQRAIALAADSLLAPSVAQALGEVDQQAKDVCKTTLLQPG